MVCFLILSQIFCTIQKIILTSKFEQLFGNFRNTFLYKIIVMINEMVLPVTFLKILNNCEIVLYEIILLSLQTSVEDRCIYSRRESATAVLTLFSNFIDW